MMSALVVQRDDGRWSVVCRGCQAGGGMRSNSILVWNELLEVHCTSGFHVSAIVWLWRHWVQVWLGDERRHCWWSLVEWAAGSGNNLSMSLLELVALGDERAITRRSDGRGAASVGWWVEVSRKNSAWKFWNSKLRILGIYSIILAGHFQEPLKLFNQLRFFLGGFKIGFKMARIKIDRMTLNLWVRFRDCWVLVGPYPPCTQTSAAATGIFEGGVGNPTSSKTESGVGLQDLTGLLNVSFELQQLGLGSNPPWSSFLIAAREAKAAKRRLASALAWKWKRQYSEMCGFVRVRMALAVVRANTLLLRGSRVRQSRPCPDITDGAGMEGWYQFGERFWSAPAK